MRNSVTANWLQWSGWDWSKDGDEWSNSNEWKMSLVTHVLEPNIPSGSRVLEIGPGAGRWTEFLAQRAARLYLVDLTKESITRCKTRFASFTSICYFVNNGQNLSFIQPDSIDRIWSWDVFVHIRGSDVDRYLSQFCTILVPGGRGVIHHSRLGTNELGWRSDMTAQTMRQLCKRHGLEIVEQFDCWGDGLTWVWPDLKPEQQPDIVTVFAKPN